MWPFLSLDQIEVLISVIMRVPGLFIIDFWWQYDRSKSLPQSMDAQELLSALITNVVLIHGLLLLLLPLPRVQILYTHFVSNALLLSAHLLSRHYINAEEQNTEGDEHFVARQVAALVAHILVGATASLLLSGPAKPVFPILVSYALPVAARLANFPVEALELLHNFGSAAIAISVCMYAYHQLPALLDYLKIAYSDAMHVVEVHGIMGLLSIIWNKLFVPNHFLLFWLIKFVVKLFEILSQPERAHVWSDHWYIVILTAASSLCASPVTLVSTSVTISYLAYFVLCSTKAFLHGNIQFLNDNPMHSGWTEGLTMAFLALQVGLTEMKMPARLAAMTIILFIVLSSLLQSVLEITEPVVLALSASRSSSIGRHFRALFMCCFLFIFPLYLTYALMQVFPIDFWMLVVVSSCVLTSVQVLDLLVVHSLFLYDSSSTEPWESLDDIVYYTRAVTKVMEFFVAVFVVGVGFWESLVGKWNVAGSTILLIHCYFNVWLRMQAGWKSFLLRREAVNKTEAMQTASEEQLATLNDVCAICFSDMTCACITKCNHFFHRTCLRKWLYVQDKCPLCHSIITVESTTSTPDDRTESTSVSEENSPHNIVENSTIASAQETLER